MEPIFLYLSEDIEGIYSISIKGSDRRILTPKHKKLESKNKELIESIIYELQRYESVELVSDSIVGRPIGELTLYGLLCSEIDFWKDKEDKIALQDVQNLVKSDPLTNLSPGPEIADQIHQWRAVYNFLNDFKYNDEVIEYYDIQYHVQDRKKFNFVCELLCNEFNSFPSFLKSIFINLTHLLKSPLVSWAFVRKKITPENLATINIQTCAVPLDTDDVNVSKEDLFDEFLSIGRVALNFMDLNLKRTELIEDLEESITIEFKSTFRTPFPKESQRKKFP